MAKSMEQLMELIDKMPEEAAKPGEFILPELMAIQIAHAVRNDDIVFAGTGLPMVGIMTANFLQSVGTPRSARKYDDMATTRIRMVIRGLMS